MYNILIKIWHALEGDAEYYQTEEIMQTDGIADIDVANMHYRPPTNAIFILLNSIDILLKGKKCA